MNPLDALRKAGVRGQIPGVAVPDIGNEVSRYADIIDQCRYFEPVSLSKEDLQRAALYANNSQRATQQNKFANYGEYLDSLEMVAEIDAFKPIYLERIAQLTNKKKSSQGCGPVYYSVGRKIWYSRDRVERWFKAKLKETEEYCDTKRYGVWHCRFDLNGK